jgi:ABC-type Na+ efflux pump permease subunit
MRIARRLYGEKGALIRTLMFFALLAPLPYTWWYFDLIPVFLTLIALDALLLRKEASSGTFIAMGMLANGSPRCCCRRYSAPGR